MAKLVVRQRGARLLALAHRLRWSRWPPGCVNGLLVTRLKLPPFIVTLGTLSIFTALTLIYAQGQTISLRPTRS